MALFPDFIKQAKSNLAFLNEISKSPDSYFDWKVTVCFYVGVHLINAYLVKERGMSFNSHTETFDAINPTNSVSPLKLTEDQYLAYRKLYNLSRRSRYICTDAERLKDQDDSRAYLTYDKHFFRSIKSLETLLILISGKYGENFSTTEIDLLDMRSTNLNYFKYKKAS